MNIELRFYYVELLLFLVLFPIIFFPTPVANSSFEHERASNGFSTRQILPTSLRVSIRIEILLTLIFRVIVVMNL